MEIDRFEIVAQVPASESTGKHEDFEMRPYKRWLSDDELIVFAIDESTLTYRPLRYDWSARAYHDWMGSNLLRPKVRTIPLRHFGRDGTLLSEGMLIVGPAIFLSPTRNRVCWLGADDNWITLDTRTSEIQQVVHQGREVNIGQSEYVAWYPDDQHFVEFCYSSSFKSYVEADVYSTDIEMLGCYDLKNARRGSCAGTTPTGTCVIVGSEKKGRSDSGLSGERTHITRINMDGSPLIGKWKYVSLPTNCKLHTARLAVRSERLAWLLTDSQDRMATHLWVTDMNGSELHPAVRIGKDVTERLDLAGDCRAVDLEWLPDESGVSFVIGHTIVNYRI